VRDLFPSFNYKYPEGEEFQKLWQNAVFIFDANMLLNVYRYSPRALNRYFEILDKLKERIWIPNQAAYEMPSPCGADGDVRRKTSRLFTDCPNNLSPWSKNAKTSWWISGSETAR
jgi:hypothetical protein